MTDSSADPAHLIPANAKLRASRRLWRVLFFLSHSHCGPRFAGPLCPPARQRRAGRPHRPRRHRWHVIATDPRALKTLEDLPRTTLVKAVIVAINSPGGTTAGGEELYEALASCAPKSRWSPSSRARRLGRLHDRHRRRPHLCPAALDRRLHRRALPARQCRQAARHHRHRLRQGADRPAQGRAGHQRAAAGGGARLAAGAGRRQLRLVRRYRRRAPRPRRPETLALADGRIVTGRQALEARLIDAIGGEAEAIAWLEASGRSPPILPVVDYYPLPRGAGSIRPISWAGGAHGLWARSPPDRSRLTGWSPFGRLAVPCKVARCRGGAPGGRNDKVRARPKTCRRKSASVPA
jgi:protease IV